MKPETTIFQTLAYFDMFSHPLTAEEIWRFAKHPCSKEELLPVLDEMVNKGMLFRCNGFYLLCNEPSRVDRRLKGNQRAAALMHTAYQNAVFIQQFPFVTGVGISGSLSKQYADEGTDIDFFIITRPDRLWIARTCLHAFKKLTFLTGRQHYFCMNYFIDEEALTISEKNIFTATEVVTLIPVCGHDAMADFFSANQWVQNFLPNQPSEKQNQRMDPSKPLLSRMLQKCCMGVLGDRLDKYLMRVTEKRWVKKEKKHQQNMKGDPVGLRITRHTARPNPEHLQRKLLGMYQNRLSELSVQYGIEFP